MGERKTARVEMRGMGWWAVMVGDEIDETYALRSTAQRECNRINALAADPGVWVPAWMVPHAVNALRAAVEDGGLDEDVSATYTAVADRLQALIARPQAGEKE